MESSVIAIMLLNKSVNSLTVPVKAKISNKIQIFIANNVTISERCSIPSVSRKNKLYLLEFLVNIFISIRIAKRAVVKLLATLALITVHSIYKG